MPAMRNTPNTIQGYLSVGGGKLRFDTCGKGFPLIFIHAGVADRRMWDHQLSFFAENYQVIRYDLRGYGESQTDSVSFCSVEDLRTIFNEFKLQKAIIIGCSKGGEVALGFTLEYPELVERLVLVGSGVVGYEPSDKDYWKKVLDAIQRKDVHDIVQLTIDMWVVGPTRKSTSVKPEVLELAKEMLSTSYERPLFSLLSKEWFHDRTKNLFQHLTEIKAPTLILIGEHDNLDLLEIANRLHEGITNSKKILIQNTAHLPSMEEPHLFNQILQEFITSK
ncbi:MAG: alpha/beta fold hydrolase [Candidatus Hodarchaeales archaeon]|jgi:pimeloyl-ACP methyl ester carboxylesterase